VLIGRDPATVPLQSLWAWERERRLTRDDDGLDWERDLRPMADFFAQSLSDEEMEGEYVGGYFH
jgi:hypothetical protein